MMKKTCRILLAVINQFHAKISVCSGSTAAQCFICYYILIIIYVCVCDICDIYIYLPHK